MVTHSIARVLWCRNRHILIALMPYCLAENCTFWFNERSSLTAIMKGHLMPCYGIDRCVRVCVHAHIHTLKLYFQTVSHQFLYSSPPVIDSCCTFFLPLLIQPAPAIPCYPVFHIQYYLTVLSRSKFSNPIHIVLCIIK